MTRLGDALEQIRFARLYTRDLVGNFKEADWFRQPTEGVTHLAWQVGHLAMAQYRLALERIRGRRPEDASLISDEFLLLFGRGSVVDPDPARYPSIGEIRGVLDRVHRQAIDELEDISDAELDEPPLQPHRLFTTKLGSLRWCSQHEMLHVGQIGLLRRLLGYKPLR